MDRGKGGMRIGFDDITTYAFGYFVKYMLSRGDPQIDEKAAIIRFVLFEATKRQLRAIERLLEKE